MPSARTWRRAAVVGGLGLAGVYAFEAAQYHRTAGKGFELEDPPAPGTPDFARMVEALTVAPLRQGNRVTVLRNGAEIFPAMLEAIRSAERTHQLRHLRLLDGQHRPRVRRGPGRAGRGRGRGQRAARRRRGGQDGPLPDRPAGATPGPRWPGSGRPKWYTLHKLNNRTHRKILVVDGRVGFTGGVGIAEEWTGNCEDAGHWRDTHVRVEGPAARDLFGGFLDNWAEATQCILSGPRPPARHRRLRRRRPGPGHPEHGREGLDRRRAPVLRGHRLRQGADLADHRLLRPPAGVRRGPLRGGRARGRRARAHQRPPHRQAGRPPGRAPHLRADARVRGAHLRVPADHAPRQGDDRGRQLGDGRVDQLRQPLLRPQRRAQPVAARPGRSPPGWRSTSWPTWTTPASWTWPPGGPGRCGLRARELASAAVRREL